MAYIPKEEDREEVVGQPQLATPSASLSQSAVQPTAQTQPKKDVGSGLYTNLQDYVQANKPATAKLAESAIKPFQQKAQQISQQAGQKGTTLQKQLDPAQKTLQQAPTSIQNIVSGAGTGLTQQQRQLFQRLRQGQVGAGIQAPSLAEEKRQAEAIRKQSEDLRREQGRSRLVSEAFRSPTYTRGQKTLDAMLLQQDPAARQKIYRELPLAAQQAQKDVTSQEASQRAQIDALRQLSAQRATEAQKAVTGAQESLRGNLQSQAEAANLASQDLYNRAIQGDPEALSTLGVDVYGSSTFYGLDPKQYLQQAPTAYAGQFATDQEIARLSALADLAGTNRQIVDRDAYVRGDLGATGLQGAIEAQRARYGQETSALEQELDRRQTEERNRRIGAEQAAKNAYVNDLAMNIWRQAGSQTGRGSMNLREAEELARNLIQSGAGYTGDAARYAPMLEGLTKQIAQAEQQYQSGLTGIQSDIEARKAALRKQYGLS